MGLPNAGDKYSEGGVEGAVLRVRKVPNGHRIYVRTAPGKQKVVSVLEEKKPAATETDKPKGDKPAK